MTSICQHYAIQAKLWKGIEPFIHYTKNSYQYKKIETKVWSISVEQANKALRIMDNNYQTAFEYLDSVKPIKEPYEKVKTYKLVNVKSSQRSRYND